MEQAGLTPPLFESDRGNDQFVGRYFFQHFLGAEDIAWLAQFKDLHLSEDEAKALIVVREAGAINNGHLPRADQGGHPDRQPSPAPPARCRAAGAKGARLGHLLCTDRARGR